MPVPVGHCPCVGISIAESGTSIGHDRGIRQSLRFAAARGAGDAGDRRIVGDGNDLALR